MSKKNKGKPGYNKQGIKDLNHIKGPSVGRKVELPFDGGIECDHFGFVRDMGDFSQCSKCRAVFDFDGKQF